MKSKLGSTGLTQKEAIYQIVISYLGDRLQTGVSVESLIFNKNSGGRDYKPRWYSPELEEIVRRVAKGISDGTIRSKYNTTAKDQDKKTSKEIAEYSNRITHYWLRHDKRLNGGQSASRISKAKKRQIVLRHLMERDEQLKAMKMLIEQRKLSVEEVAEIQSHIMGRKFAIILEAFDINLNELPDTLLRELLILPQTEQAA